MAWAAPFDPFEALGVERDAHPSAIKRKYHKLAHQYHPNSNEGSDQSKAALSGYFHRVHQAWQVLRRPDRRRRYTELLELYDIHETILASAADLLADQQKPEPSPEHHGQPSADGHVSSDADEDYDLPRLAGIKRRTTFDHPAQGDLTPADEREVSDSADHTSAGELPGTPGVTQLRSSAEPRRGGDRNGPNTSTAVRRKNFDKLRRKELEAFYKYRDAMVDKFEAEEEAERYREAYEQAKWRREYFERAPREMSERVRLLRLFNNAATAFTAQKPPKRQRNGSTVNYGAQILSAGDPFENKQLLGLPPSRAKSFHRRMWSSDISGDQTSSDENDDAGEKTTQRTKATHSHSSPQQNSWSNHKQWDSVPSLVPLEVNSLPNGQHDPISPITGPVKVFLRTPTNLHRQFDAEGSDADTASASSRSTSSRPSPSTSGKYVLVPTATTAHIFRCPERKSRSRSPVVERRSPSRPAAAPGNHHSSHDTIHFQIKPVGKLHFRSIPMDHVHNLSYAERQWMLGVDADEDVDPSVLMERLAELDQNVARRFMVKPDVKAKFNFRLIYNHRQPGLRQHHSFIALSYRRKHNVVKKHGHFTLPLEPEMFQAVWDERQSDTEGVWIDQICIDGDNEEEKTISMSAMDMVYRSARVVVVTLDDIQLEAHEGTALESHMNEFNRMVHVPANKRFRRKPTPYLDTHEDLNTVCGKILKSSWFQRAWCRHEMRLAREHIFLVPCRSQDSRSGTSVLRLTSKCLTHFLGLATEVAFERSIESVKPALYAFFRDRNKLATHENHLRSHHGNFTTVVAEVFAMEAGGDPRIPEAQRAADARKDKISIVLNTMDCGLALEPSVRDPRISLPMPECNYMLLMLSLAARDPGALSSVGHPMRQLPFASSSYEKASSWLFEPTNVDSGLNNYRTLNRLPEDSTISTGKEAGEHFVQLELKFLRPERVLHPFDSSDGLTLARHFVEVCERKNFGRNRKRYLSDKMTNSLFGPMREVYVDTLACVFECGPDWVSDVCQRYGVSRWKYDLRAAYELLIALQNTNGRWPDTAWNSAAAGFIMDFVNFLIIRGLPQRMVTQRELWRPIWVSPPLGGKVLTFVPPNNVCPAVPAALLDSDYIHLARLWLLERRQRTEEESHAADGTLPVPAAEWTLLGKSVLFSDDVAIHNLETRHAGIKANQKVFGRTHPSFSPSLRARSPHP